MMLSTAKDVIKAMFHYYVYSKTKLFSRFCRRGPHVPERQFDFDAEVNWKFPKKIFSQIVLTTVSLKINQMPQKMNPSQTAIALV